MTSNPSQPMTIDQAMRMAAGMHRAGQLQQAETIYRQVLAQVPNHPDALNLLGYLALQVGRPEAAVDLIQRAIRFQPLVASYHSHLGQALAAMNRLNEAIEEYHEALRLKPDYAEAHNNLGNALRELNQIDRAIASLQRAIAAKPEFAEAHNNLGTAFLAASQWQQAINEIHEAISLKPNFAEARVNLGTAFQMIGQSDHAIVAYEEAIALNPQMALAHYNLGMALLQKGDYRRGWAEHEWRWQVKDLDLPPREDFDKPMWDGGDLSGGKRIFLLAEQGFGDTIHFARYAPLLADRGATVILGCQAELVRLMQTLEGVQSVVTHGHPIPDFDVYCPLMSLPFVTKTQLDSIPTNVPYLRADPELSARWRERIPSSTQRLKVGLAWAGRPTHKNDRNRSLGLEELAPLSQVENLQFVNLQKGAKKGTAPSLSMIDLSDELNDFSDTAALIETLDVVVSVDTAVAHLAGAMGKPVWLLLPVSSDWRWLLDRDDSPWYPTMRLFRQPMPGDWRTPIEQIASELSRW